MKTFSSEWQAALDPIYCTFVNCKLIFNEIWPAFTAIRTSDVDDVRDVLAYYKQFDDPIEAFRENQRKLQVIVHIIL